MIGLVNTNLSLYNVHLINLDAKWQIAKAIAISFLCEIKLYCLAFKAIDDILHNNFGYVTG